MKVKYKCKDNDVILQFHFVDGKIDEVWVQIDGEKGWTVIGYNDLLSGIKKAEQFCKNDVVIVVDNGNYKASYAEQVPFKAKVKEKYDNENLVVSLVTGKEYELYYNQILEDFCKNDIGD